MSKCRGKTKYGKSCDREALLSGYCVLHFTKEFYPKKRESAADRKRRNDEQERPN